MDVWSCLGVLMMTSSSKYGDIRCRRRRQLINFFRPSDSLWSGDFSYQNSAPFHVLNSSYRVRVRLTPPESSTSKKPRGGRVKRWKFEICLILPILHIYRYIKPIWVDARLFQVLLTELNIKSSEVKVFVNNSSTTMMEDVKKFSDRWTVFVDSVVEINQRLVAQWNFQGGSGLNH